MTNIEALELVYRKPCITQEPPKECGHCELGEKSKCKIYEAYMQLYNYLRISEIMKKTLRIRE